VDTLFRIMSMTKMPCTVAALQQVEQGKLDLDAPVTEYCPEFAEVQVLDGFDGDTPRLRSPARPATVRNLVTHTSGLGYWFWSEDLVRWEKLTGVPNVVAGSRACFTAPTTTGRRRTVRGRPAVRTASVSRRPGRPSRAPWPCARSAGTRTRAAVRPRER